jgi:type IV pilus assembly protein PilA
MRVELGHEGGPRRSYGRGHHHGCEGFTVLEVLIVLALIGIVAATAIASIASSRMAGNEASALATLRAIAAANSQYRFRFLSFASGLDDLSDSAYLDTKTTSGTKAGYLFQYVGATNDFSVQAAPEDPGRTGNRYFHIDMSGMIHYHFDRPALPTDDVIQF